jgi:hypothetical protein
MNVKQLLALTTLAIAAGTALAQDNSLTRADVRQQVLAARAAGTLIPAGEGIAPGYPTSGDRASTLSRSQVKAGVLQARASGELQPAGEGTPENRAYAQAVSTPSTLARADVKADVLEARANGELIPAGEGVYPNAAEATHVAVTPGKASNFFAFLHRSH